MATLSLSGIFADAAKAVKRFPVSIAAAYIAAILMIVANHYLKLESFIGGYIAALVFAFSFALAVDLFMESRKFSFPLMMFYRILVLIIVSALYYFLFRFFNDWNDRDIMQFVLLNLASLSLVLFAPFTAVGKMNGFWQLTVGLFIRILQAFFFFGILYVGFAALIASIDYLFEVNIPEQYYFDVWLVITGFLVSTFVLAGISPNLQALDRSSAYPKFLQILTEYFLVPLVFLYLLVLYVYFGKILVTFEWPDGGVAWWIIGFSFVGVLTYFLAYSQKFKFMRHVEFFRQWFFVSLIPILAVLFTAIYLRISQYGITEPRYFVVMYGIWLSVLCAYFIISKSKSLKLIPVLLFVFLLFSSYGPQSAFGVAKWSQLQRLESALVENKMFVDGKVVKADLNVVDQTEAGDIGSMVFYLVKYHGVEALQPWFDQDLEADNVLVAMGIENVYYDSFLSDGGTYDQDSYLTFTAKGCDQNYCSINVSGFDEYFPFYSYADAEQIFSLGGKSYQMAITAEKSQNLVFKETACENCAAVIEIDLITLVEDLIAKYGKRGSYNVRDEELIFSFGSGEIRIQSIGAVFREEEFVKIDSVGGALLLRKSGTLPPA